MTKRNILTAALAALGALAIAFTLVLSSPAAEAQPNQYLIDCNQCVMQAAQCFRAETRLLWRLGEDIDLGAAMKAIGRWSGCEMENCRADPAVGPWATCNFRDIPTDYPEVAACIPSPRCIVQARP